MNTTEATFLIEQELARRRKTILNRNAIGALFAALGDQAGALGKIFLGRQDALDAEKQKIALDVIIELLCKIDESISASLQKAQSAGITISGAIAAAGTGPSHVVGVDIDGASSVTFTPGTVVTASGSGGPVTGVRIGSTERK
jgi:uncharacterized membrane protein